MQLQEFSHGLFREARWEGGVALRSQHSMLWADVLATPALPWVWVAALSPFPPPMLFPNPCNAFPYSKTSTCAPPHLTPLTSTTFCLGTSSQPSSKAHVLTRQWRRQSVGSVVPISFTSDMTRRVSVLSPATSFDLILQGFMSLRTLLSLPGVGEVTWWTRELMGAEGWETSLREDGRSSPEESYRFCSPGWKPCQCFRQCLQALLVKQNHAITTGIHI